VDADTDPTADGAEPSDAEIADLAYHQELMRLRYLRAIAALLETSAPSAGSGDASAAHDDMVEAACRRAERILLADLSPGTP